MTKRSYRLGARAVAAQQTRAHILDAAEKLFGERWFDEVTLTDIAACAGVAQQTVANHFGSKEQLYLEGLRERVGPRIAELRATARAGDLDSVVRIAVADYEQTGVGALRMMAAAERYPAMADAAALGHRSHAAWVAEMFAPQLAGLPPAARTRTDRLLRIVLDVRTWAQLRLEQGRSIEETVADLTAMLTAVLGQAASPNG